MAWLWTALLLLVFCYLIQSWLNKYRNKNKTLPPGPKGLPIFGSLHLLREFPHRDLQSLAQKHGPIMYMQLGLMPAVIVSSPQAAELFLKTYDHVFASRPFVLAAKYIAYEQKNLGFAPYGSYWREMRKMCTLALLSNLKINSFKSMRKQELLLLTQSLKEDAGKGSVVDLTAKVSGVNAYMSCLMVFGKKYMDSDFDKRGFQAVIQEAVHLGAIPNLGDYIPFIAPLDLQRLTRRMKDIAKVFDGFFDMIIDEHIQFKDETRTKDFVDVMLSFMGSEETEYRIGRSHIKAMMLDMLAASMDTSANTIDWAIAELTKHPHIMKKVQNELQDVVGLERMVEESDLENLHYLDMVMKEILRLHPPAPLLLPHQSIEDCSVEGFHIPAKARVIINIWAIGQDPSVWPEPEKFNPERFVGSEIDYRGHHFQLIPFGSGRRGCPGMQLGLTIVRLVLAQLVHCFDWELPDGMLPSELDMTEKLGLSCPRAKHLMAVLTYRLHM